MGLRANPPPPHSYKQSLTPVHISTSTRCTSSAGPSQTSLTVVPGAEIARRMVQYAIRLWRRRVVLTQRLWRRWRLGKTYRLVGWYQCINAACAKLSKVQDRKVWLASAARRPSFQKQ